MVQGNDQFPIGPVERLFSDGVKALDVIAYRLENRTKQEAILDFFSRYSTTEYNVRIEENTFMVDGIGGTTWEGSLILGRLVGQLLQESSACTDMDILELGAGAGLVSLHLANMGHSVVVTDRFSDLASQNFASFCANNPKVSIRADLRDLDWAEDSLQTLTDILQSHSNIRLVVGAEITCLRKQHRYLVKNLLEISRQSPNALMLFTFDGVAQAPHVYDSQYEKEFLSAMKEHGFAFSVIHNAKVSWVKETTESMVQNDKLSQVAHYEDLSGCVYQDFDMVSRSILSRQESNLTDYKAELPYDDTFYHHIIAFYRPTLVNTCSRCTRQFVNHPLLNNHDCCRFHPGLFVCRKHPAELRCSINGQGDNLGYYGNGEEGWPALFWDCCGSENQNEIGCKAGNHIPYY